MLLVLCNPVSLIFLEIYLNGLSLNRYSSGARCYLWIRYCHDFLLFSV